MKFSRTTGAVRAASTAIVLSIALAGCTPANTNLTGPTATPHPRPSKTTAAVSPAPTASVSPAPALAPVSDTDACRRIITADAWTTLTTGENHFFSDFTTDWRRDPGDLRAFLDYRGIACRWGHDSSDVVYDFATSDLTTDQAVAQKSALASRGWLRSTSASGTERWTNPADDIYHPVIEFLPGRWRYVLVEADLDLFA